MMSFLTVRFLKNLWYKIGVTLYIYIYIYGQSLATKQFVA